MFSAISCSVFLALASSITAIPSFDHASRLSLRAKTCTVKASGNNKTDDTPAFTAALKECGSGSTIIFQEGVN
jgi:hypothetical protein